MAGRRVTRRASVLGQRPKTLAQAEFTSAEHVKSFMGSPQKGTPFVGRDDPGALNHMQKWGSRASPAQRVTWGEDEQGSGVRNARQPGEPHKADQPCGERTNSGTSETCPQGQGE